MASDEDKLKLDLYWKMYNEHATQARHHESLRGTISTILVAVSAGIFSLHKDFGSKYDVYVGILLIALGSLGCLLSYKHYERNRLHVSTLREFRKEIDGILRGWSISVPNTTGRNEHEREYPFSSRYLRLHHLWIVIFIFVIVGGILIVIIR